MFCPSTLSVSKSVSQYIGKNTGTYQNIDISAYDKNITSPNLIAELTFSIPLHSKMPTTSFAMTNRNAM